MSGRCVRWPAPRVRSRTECARSRARRRLRLDRPARRFSVAAIGSVDIHGVSTSVPQRGEVGGRRSADEPGFVDRGPGRGPDTIGTQPLIGVRRTRDRPSSAAESRGRAVGARRHPHRPRRGHRGRRVPAAGRLLPAGERADLRGRPRPVRAARADRHRHRRRVARAARTSSRRSAAGPTSRASRTRRRPPSTSRSTPGSSSARRSCAT